MKPINKYEEEFNPQLTLQQKGVMKNLVKEEINKVFRKINKIIKETKSKVPVPINESKLLERYNKLKEEYR